MTAKAAARPRLKPATTQSSWEYPWSQSRNHHAKQTHSQLGRFEHTQRFSYPKNKAAPEAGAPLDLSSVALPAVLN
eukprot:987985-Amphidinium_carterae.1